MSANYVVVGRFNYVEDTCSAIRAMREKGYSDLALYSPIPHHDLDDEMYRGKRRSPVRMFTLLGGLTGCLGAFLFTTWMSVDYPIRTSAKPLISIPAFVIIAFECTILLGAIATLASMFHFSRIPNVFRSPGYKPSFSEGEFGIVVKVPKADVEETKTALQQAGAAQVEVEYVR